MSKTMSARRRAQRLVTPARFLVVLTGCVGVAASVAPAVGAVDRCETGRPSCVEPAGPERAGPGSVEMVAGTGLIAMGALVLARTSSRPAVVPHQVRAPAAKIVERRTCGGDTPH